MRGHDARSAPAGAATPARAERKPCRDTKVDGEWNASARRRALQSARAAAEEVAADSTVEGSSRLLATAIAGDLEHGRRPRPEGGEPLALAVARHVRDLARLEEDRRRIAAAPACNLADLASKARLLVVALNDRTDRPARLADWLADELAARAAGERSR